MQKTIMSYKMIILSKSLELVLSFRPVPLLLNTEVSKKFGLHLINLRQIKGEMT